MREAGLTDPADLIDDAVRLLRDGAEIQHQIIAGFYDTTGVQQKLIDALAEAGKIDCIAIPVPLDGETPGAAFASRFSRRAIEITGGAAEAAPGAPRAPEVVIQRETTRSREIEEICRRIAGLIAAGTDPGSIAIVFRNGSPDLDALVRHHARNFGFQVPAASHPLAAHRVVRAMLLLPELRERHYPRRDVLEILYSGYRPSSGPIRRDDLEEIDRITRKHQIPGGSAEEIRAILPRIRNEKAEDEPVVLRYLGIVEDLEALQIPRTEGATGRHWAASMEKIAGRFRPETAADLAVFDALDTIGDTLRRLDLPGARLDLRDVSTLIHASGEIAGEAPDHPIWIGDVMRLRGRTFDHLFLAAVEEDLFPQRRTPDALLPDPERRTIGVHEVGDGLEEEHLLLDLTLGAARTRAHVSFAAADAAGRPRRPSHLLKALAGRLDPDHAVEINGGFEEWLSRHRPAPAEARSRGEDAAERLLAADLQPGMVSPAMLRRLQMMISTGTRSNRDGYLTVTPEITQALTDRLTRSISPTHLEDYGECPQRFLFKRILRIREVEDPDHELEIEPRRRGSLRHRILERFYQSLEDHEIAGSAERRSLPDPLRERLSRVIDEQFVIHDREFPPWNRLIREIERKATHRILERFVAEDLSDLDENDLRPRHFELRFGAWSEQDDPVPLEIGGVSMSIRGSIDRVDQHRDETRYRIVDYKSGAAGHLDQLEQKIATGHALQLPLYAIVAAGLFDVPDSSISAVIKPLQRKQKLERFGFELSDARANLDRILTLFVDEIRRGTFPAFPSDEVCRFCPVQEFCRTRHDPVERYAMERYANALDLLGGLDGEE